MASDLPRPRPAFSGNLAGGKAVRYTSKTRMCRKLRWLLCVSLALGGAHYTPAASGLPAQAGHSKKPRGRPRVVLDSLVLAASMAAAPSLERHLRAALKRESRRADWGAGHGSTIALRFIVEELSITEAGGVVVVSCTALGKLPKGKVARSHLKFSGAPAERHELTKRVLEIVTRGVIGRLAELERIRRGGR